VPNQQNLVGVVGRPLASAAMQATGFGGTVTYALSGAPPAGTTFNTSTGVLSGTPTQTWSQTYVITATGSTSGSATASLTVTVGTPS